MQAPKTWPVRLSTQTRGDLSRELCRLPGPTTTYDPNTKESLWKETGHI